MNGRSSSAGWLIAAIGVNLALSGWLLIDTLQGYLDYRGSGLAVVPRSLKVALFLFFVAVSLSRRVGLRIVLALGLLFSISLVVLTLRGAADPRTVEVAIKLSMPLVAATTVLSVNGGYRTSWSKAIVLANAVVLVANMIFSILGIGIPTYLSDDGTSIGGSGFFFAGNEVSGAILFCMASLLLFYRNAPLGLAVSIVAMLFSAAALMSRAALAGTVLLSAVFIFRQSRGFLVASGVAVFLILSRFSGVLLVPLELAWSRWSFLAREYGLGVYAVGGAKRLEAIQAYLGDVASKPMLLITGSGWSGAAENNLVDLVQAFGLAGVVVFALWVAALFPPIPRILFGKMTLTRDDGYFLVVSLMLFATMVLAGHVAQSTLIVPFAAVYIARNVQRLNSP